MNKFTVSMIVGSTLMLPLTARAMPSFPGQIQQHLGLANPPSCMVCHGSTQGGGPISQPFGQAMLADGLNSSGGNSLTGALDKMEADKTDSNGDGVPDIEGLRQGIEPTPDKPPVVYGCGGGRIAPRGHMGWPDTAAAIITFALLAYRSSRGARKTSHARETNHNSRVGSVRA
jgi:hypothetical protein